MDGYGIGGSRVGINEMKGHCTAIEKDNREV